MSSLSVPSSIGESYVKKFNLKQQNNEFHVIGACSVSNKLTKEEIDVKIVSLIKNKANAAAFEIRNYDKEFIDNASGVFQVLDNSNYVLGIASFSEFTYKKDGSYGAENPGFYGNHEPTYGNERDGLKNVSQVYVQGLASYVRTVFGRVGNILMRCLFEHSLNKGHEMRLSLQAAFNSAFFYSKFRMLVLDPYGKDQLNDVFFKLAKLSKEKFSKVPKEAFDLGNGMIMYFPVLDADKKSTVSSLIYHSPITMATSTAFRQVLGDILGDSRAKEDVVKNRCLDLVWSYL